MPSVQQSSFWKARSSATRRRTTAATSGSAVSSSTCRRRRGSACIQFREAGMNETELLILGLCVAIPTLGVIAGLLRIPYPIVLVLGAIPIGYLPGMPDVELDPDLVLVIFLPPL